MWYSETKAQRYEGMRSVRNQGEVLCRKVSGRVAIRREACGDRGCIYKE
jgi:hypothetical protein